MKNYSNHSSKSNMQNDCFDCGYIMEDISVFVTFEILVALMSLLVVSASSLVIYKITKSQLKKIRYDVAFICLSVSDIGVGLFSVPIPGIREYYDRSCRSIPLIVNFAIILFTSFPYSFSCLFTTFIAVDRMFAITLAQKYTNLISQKIFKVIAITLFLISVTGSSILITQKKYIIVWIHNYVELVSGVVCLAVVMLAHLFILHFATRRKELKQLRKHHGKNSNGKRLTNTIICVCTSQLICFIPYLLLRFLQLRGHIPYKLYEDMRPWLGLLVYCQCFCNALIILHNKKNKNISKK